MRLFHQISRFLAVGFIVATGPAAFAADENVWTVSKSSGDVWLTSDGIQAASLKQEELLKPGSTVRTGRNGRVLLRRGEETMLISPNSVIGIPSQKTEGLSTTIVQQAGSILLEVEKRNVKHFEVETPYLAAVVKGTKFRVNITAGSTSVDVIRGQVEVADFRSGQIAQVMPGQHATSFTQDNKVGLLLSGSGTFNPIEQGKPRTPSVERVPVPRAGLTAPSGDTKRQASQSSANDLRNQARKPSENALHQGSGGSTARGSIRISSAIGEVKLNIHKVTHGLAQDRSLVNGSKRDGSTKETVWGPSNMGTSQSVTSVDTQVYLSKSNAGSASASTNGPSSSDNGNSNGGRNGAGNGAAGNGSANNGGNSSGNYGAGSGYSAGNNGNGSANNGSNNGKSTSGNGGNGNNRDGNHGNDNSGNGSHGNDNNGNGNRGNGNNSSGNNGNGNNGKGNSGSANSGNGNGNGNGGNGNGNANGNNGNGRGRG